MTIFTGPSWELKFFNEIKEDIKMKKLINALVILVIVSSNTYATEAHYQKFVKESKAILKRGFENSMWVKLYMEDIDDLTVDMMVDKFYPVIEKPGNKCCRTKN